MQITLLPLFIFESLKVESVYPSIFPISIQSCPYISYLSLHLSLLLSLYLSYLPHITPISPLYYLRNAHEARCIRG